MKNLIRNKRLLLRKITFFPLFFLFLLNGFANVTVKDDRIYLDGKLFFIKGICYSPSYPGQGCGPIIFQNLSEEIRETDFKMMKEAGFNTLRIYESMFDDFYEYANKYGLMVIEPLMKAGAGTNISSEKSIEDYKNEALKRVRKMKDNPAVLMWSLWNDAPFKPSLVEKYGLKKVDDFFREIHKAIKEEDPDHPVTGANMINVKGYEMGFEFLDVIGCNTYVGLDHSNQSWERVDYSNIHAKQSMNLLEDLVKKYKKPVFITETGCSTFRKLKKQDDILEKQLKRIGEDLSGVCIFEWTDEWWKAGNFEKQDEHVEEHWGILDGYRREKPGYQTVCRYFKKVPDQSKGFPRSLFQGGKK